MTEHCTLWSEKKQIQPVLFTLFRHFKLLFATLFWTVKLYMPKKILKIPLYPLLLVLVSCSAPPSQIEKIVQRGDLRIVTTYGPTTYLIDSDSETGFEYELARLFAEQLNVRLKVIVATNKANMIEILKRGEADIAVGLIKKTYAEDQDLITGPEYQSVTLQVIHKNGFSQPKTLNELSPFQLHMPEGLIRLETLNNLKQEYQDFSWKLHGNQSSSDLIELVQDEQIAYAAVYSNEAILAQQTYPELRTAFAISDPSPLIWVIRKAADNSMQVEIESFYQGIVNSDYLTDLIEYFYGPVNKFDYVDQRRFLERYNTRLPKYELLFKQAAAEYEFDWRFLAAMSYQESHWDERARSPTGVRGLMMLTQNTAQHLKVLNRLDPLQSIMGGAEYFRQMLNAIPERIQQPDRIWLALAAYNIGFAHLEDARVITQKRGGNPDKWQDVKESLPLLGSEQWRKDTLFRTSRGNQAVTYVENIRKYYNTLIQLTHDETAISNEQPARMIQIETLAL